MNILSTHTRTLLAGLFTLSLTACATSKPIAAQDVLLSNIAAEEVGLYASHTERSSDDPVCRTFYENTVSFMGQPAKTGSEEILETMFLAALAGGATYGVGALGITNAFAALSLAASTNQIVYEGGKAAMDSGDKVKSDLSPDVEIADAAMRLGCPQPSKAAIKLAVIEAREDKKTQRRLAKLRKRNSKMAGKDVVCREGVQNC